ncbi:branched-chain amino acid ABC transporter permease [Affinirhizobium pseudoryzae]|uniref:branched-chain amino acid ABC transporter permease n=1 Tax=Allorhizobium pseudoryzae TaxID=379684 RepID=UPI0013EC992C|nr:branched-chain amino acid ABC transporter permease [Allorhizobium pseudoryzae]
MAYTVQLLVNALPLAALYAALAFGYAIAFAITKRADITYGALFACSGHVFLLVSHMAWNTLFLTFPAALGLGAGAAICLVSGLGVLIGWRIVAPLAKISPNALTVASLGLLLVLMEGARLAAETRELWLPPFWNGPVGLVPGVAVTLTVLQLVNAAVLTTMVASGALFLRRSRWGRYWRAVCEDRLAAEFCGVHAAGIAASAYGLAALFAALSGILATAYYGTMDFGAGLVFGLKVILISAVGGHYHPLKAALGAAAIGLAETLWSGFGPVVWRDVAVLGGLVALLVMRQQARGVG